MVCTGLRVSNCFTAARLEQAIYAYSTPICTTKAGESMTEAKQQFTYATILLRRDHLRQPALLDPLFPNRTYYLPKLSQAQKHPAKEGDEHRATG